MEFDGYQFKDYLVRAIKDLGFKQFSPIQKMVFDNVNNNRNIIAKSKTGSGKTHAYLLPVFDRLDPELNKCQAVIVSPTIELARQILKVAKHLASFCDKTITIKAYFGGTDLQKEIAKLEGSQPQVVIATPGRLEDLVIKQNVLKIHEASSFIIDEADMVVDSFLDELLQLSNSIANCTKMVFSATYNENILQLIKKYLGNTVFLEPKEEDVKSLHIEHYLIPIKYQERDVILEKLVSIINPYLAIIFVNKVSDVEGIYAMLKEKGYSVCQFSGDIDIRSRKRIINEINSLKYQYVVSSDILSRGIDIVGVSHIINYELPYDFEFYIHRSGRSGRMEFDGICYSLYSDVNETYLANLEKKGITFSYLTIKNGELVPAKERNSRLNRVKPQTEDEIKAKKMLGNKKTAKVKPGYKKKYNEEVKKITKKNKKR